MVSKTEPGDQRFPMLAREGAGTMTYSPWFRECERLIPSRLSFSYSENGMTSSARPYMQSLLTRKRP